MASEAILKELFQVAKKSILFKGLSDENIWNACLTYQSRPDEHMRVAMDNIRKKDQEAEAESQRKVQKLVKGKEKMKAMHQQEEGDRQKDTQNADQILADLFK